MSVIFLLDIHGSWCICVLEFEINLLIKEVIYSFNPNEPGYKYE